ncbi:MAG: hypothetical protein QXE07_03210 [Thermoplasmata archaeon]
MLFDVKSVTIKYENILKNNDTLCCKKSFLNKKNRWYAGIFYTSFFIYKYGFATPMIGYRHLNRNGTFFGFTTLIIPEFDISILYSFLVSGYQLGVPLNHRRNLFFYLENGPMYFYTSKNFWHVPNFYLNYERCFSKKLAYSVQTGGYIGPALGEKSRYMGLMRGSNPVERKIVYGVSIKLNIRFL